MESKRFVLVHDNARQNAAKACMDAPDGYIVTFAEPKKSRSQEKKYHSMIGDIAAQVEHCGRKWCNDHMKRFMVDFFKKETIDDPELKELWKSMDDIQMAPSFDGVGYVVLGSQTKKFPKRLAAAFIEWLYAFGNEYNVIWTDER